MSEKNKTRRSIEAVLSGVSPQKNYQQAYDLALEQVRKVDPVMFERLGAVAESDQRISVAVLGGQLRVDLSAGTVHDPTGADAKRSWAILLLHYLLARPVPEPSGRFISFMDIADARGYAGPYTGRVVGRFLRTAGKDQASFEAAAERLRAEKLGSEQLAFQFAVLPKVPVRIIWYGGDDELAPGASFLYQEDIVSIFCVEDIVVMSELLVSALSGK